MAGRPTIGAEKRVAYSGTLPVDLLERAKARAHKERLTFSRMVEWAIREYLDRADPKLPQPRARKETLPVPPMAAPAQWTEKEPDNGQQEESESG